MKYSKKFKDYIEICNKENECVGLGNPNSKILLIGKEAGIKSNEENYHGSAKSWIDNIVDYSERYLPSDKKQDTWKKYEKLYNLILEKLGKENNKTDYITFVENCFTTELNNLHASTTIEAKKREGFKENLAKRKKIILETDFIKSFPITILTANDNKYIETYPGEVCERFNVEFIEEIIIKESEKIWVHYNKKEQEPKLVIHTRQLAMSSNLLVEKLAEIVSGFVNKNNISIIVK